MSKREGEGAAGAQAGVRVKGLVAAKDSVLGNPTFTSEAGRLRSLEEEEGDRVMQKVKESVTRRIEQAQPRTERPGG